jgi:CP family cyanate transporter-like MFS transporter
MPQASTERAALIVIAAGVCAALHVGKLAPAIAALQQALGLTLVEAGFLLSGVQIAGMTLGVAFGVVADGLGARRSMVLGLALLALASAAGAVASSVPWLMALRALEGFGFLLVALPAPGLLRRLVPPGRVSLVLGVWGAYMPFGAALALLFGPLWMGWLGWRAWWWLMALLTALMAWVLARGVPPSVTAPGPTLAPGLAWSTRLAHTLSSPGPWLVAVTFAMYSSQWLAVVGFLPTIYTQAGVPGPVMGLLTALAAGVNILGNVGSGRLLQRGAAPQRLLAVGFVVMAVAATAAFAGDAAGGLPPELRYLAVLLFSGVGGLIPATLFSLAVRLAPSEHTLSTTVGWVQQWSSLGQFAGPPLVAWVASLTGGWQYTGLATGLCSLVGLILSWRLSRRLSA